MEYLGGKTMGKATFHGIDTIPPFKAEYLLTWTSHQPWHYRLRRVLLLPYDLLYFIITGNLRLL